MLKIRYVVIKVHVIIFESLNNVGLAYNILVLYHYCRMYSTPIYLFIIEDAVQKKWKYLRDYFREENAKQDKVRSGDSGNKCWSSAIIGLPCQFNQDFCICPSIMPSR